jgi:hypothetical protein
MMRGRSGPAMYLFCGVARRHGIEQLIALPGGP